MGREQAPTRAAVQELLAERTVVREAYEFLDEKRLLLAAELMKQLQRYETTLAELVQATREARQLLMAGVQRHGLQGLQVYPATVAENAEVKTAARNLMGVPLQDTELVMPASAAGTELSAGDLSAEAENCREMFGRLCVLGATLAGISGNLHRLYAEFRLTERRARALENVFLPDIEQGLNRMRTYLDELDLEEAIRVRPRRRS